MKNRIVFLAIVLCIFTFLFSSCGHKDIETEHHTMSKKLNYNIVPDDEAPDILLDTMETQKQQGFKLTYRDQGDLWIAVGYGEKTTVGYNISIEEIYDNGSKVHVQTAIIGPEKSSYPEAKPSWPHIIIKIENCSSEVYFE